MDTKLVFTGIIALSTILKTIISKLIALTMFPLRPNRIWVAIGAAFLQRCIATHLFLSGSIKTPIVLAACASTRSHGVCPWINLDKTLLTKLLLLLWSVKYVELPDSFEVYEVESARKLSPHSVLKLQRADGTRSVQCRASNIRLLHRRVSSGSSTASRCRHQRTRALSPRFPLFKDSRKHSSQSQRIMKADTGATCERFPVAALSLPHSASTTRVFNGTILAQCDSPAASAINWRLRVAIVQLKMRLTSLLKVPFCQNNSILTRKLYTEHSLIVL